jgi:hypothetical protein
MALFQGEYTIPRGEIAASRVALPIFAVLKFT